MNNQENRPFLTIKEVSKLLGISVSTINRLIKKGDFPPKIHISKRRIVFSRLRSKEMVKKLFDEIGPRFKDRPGGYTKILKCGYRNGDKADMAIIQLVKDNVELSEDNIQAEK